MLAAVQQPAGRFLTDAAPLLEKESRVAGPTLVAQVADPGGVHRPGAGAGFAAGDHPVHVLEVQIGQGFEERLCRNEPQSGRHLGQLPDAERVAGAFH